MIHGITIDSLVDFRYEMETYNRVHLIGQPRWLVQLKEGKQAGSVMFAVQTQEEQLECVRKGVTFEGMKLKVAVFKPFRVKIQCFRCQGFGHNPHNCRKPPVCRLYSNKHLIKDHICNTCKTNGSCIHTISKCTNCNGNHPANSPECDTICIIRRL